MSFRVVNLDNGQESSKLKGNVVIGRSGTKEEYQDRSPLEGVNINQYSRVPGEAYNNTISRNHIIVAENPSWIDRSRLDNQASELSTENMNLDAWDLDSTAGTYIEGYDPMTGRPEYMVGDTKIKFRPLNNYTGISGPDEQGIGLENNIESLAENLYSRGFETELLNNASWSEVKQSLENLRQATERESNTLIMYTGHGTPGGKMCLADENVSPQKFLEKVDNISGEKAVIIDQCHAGKFADETLPENTSIYMASGPTETTQGDSFIQGESRTRYAGRIVKAINSEYGEVDLDNVHDTVAAVTKVSKNNPKRIGNSNNLSEIK